MKCKNFEARRHGDADFQKTRNAALTGILSGMTFCDQYGNYAPPQEHDMKRIAVTAHNIACDVFDINREPKK